MIESDPTATATPEKLQLPTDAERLDFLDGTFRESPDEIPRPATLEFHFRTDSQDRPVREVIDEMMAQDWHRSAFETAAEDPTQT